MKENEKALEEVVLTRLLRLNAVVQGVVTGIVVGLGVFIASTLLEHTGAELSFTNAQSGGANVAVRWNRVTIEAERQGTAT